MTHSSSSESMITCRDDDRSSSRFLVDKFVKPCYIKWASKNSLSRTIVQVKTRIVKRSGAEMRYLALYGMEDGKDYGSAETHAACGATSTRFTAHRLYSRCG